jgi:hypothetical protein
MALMCAPALVASQSPKIQVELTRLAADVPAVIPEGSRGAITTRLERAQKALANHHLYLALYDLQVVFEAEAGYRLASTEKSVVDHEAFRRKWTEMGMPPDPPATRAAVVFIEALAQSTEARAPATYRASLPYAQDAGIMAGLYYLGESHGMVRFASLCRLIPAHPPGRPPALRSIAPALTAYEKDVVKAYDAAPAAKRPQYAGVNVAIKIARSLDEQGRHEGALLQYLVSRLRHAAIAGGSTAALDSLRDRVKNTIMPAGVDHSIGDFFLQLASAALDGPDAAASNAAAILDDVLPAYFEVVGK